MDSSTSLGSCIGDDEYYVAVGVQQMFPSPANGLVLLALLALGTFLAGLNLLSPELCFLGFALALAVPAIAWLKLSALFLVLGAVFLVGLVISFWPRRFT